MSDLSQLVQLPAKEAAGRVAEVADSADESWTRDFLHELNRRVRTNPVGHLSARWRLSNAEIGRMFGVSRQAVAKWITEGPPADREAQLAELDAATDLLERYVRVDRIPAVVRRRASALDESSLLELALQGRTAQVLASVRSMFDLRRVQV